MSTPTMDEAAKVLADPSAYADDERLHTALTRLRASNPATWVDNPPYRPFGAITKHEDIMAIERANDLFLSEPRPHLVTAEADDVLKAQVEAGIGIHTLVHMDDPHHRKVRAIGADGSGRRPCAISKHEWTSWPRAMSTGCSRSGRNATSSPTSH